jgi:hypothetical protein
VETLIRTACLEVLPVLFNQVRNTLIVNLNFHPLKRKVALSENDGGHTISSTTKWQPCEEILVAVFVYFPIGRRALQKIRRPSSALTIPSNATTTTKEDQKETTTFFRAIL